MFDRRVTILAGHHGSGKTELALHGASQLSAEGQAVSLVDLDVIKPYFRSRGATELLASRGVELVAPGGENVHADLPIILPRIRTLCLSEEHRVIMDVGGDSTGARAVGSLSDVLKRVPVSLYLVLNFRRPFTPDIPSALKIAEEIQAASRLSITGLISNTHLMHETTVEIILEGLRLAEGVSSALGVPLVGVGVEARLAGELPEEGLPAPKVLLQRIVRTSFEGPLRTRTSGPLFAVG